MKYTRLILKKEGHIATVTFNRPDSANAFDFKLMEEVDHVFRENLQNDDDVRAIILTGAGRHFSAGLDLSVFASADAEVGKEELKAGAATSRIGEQQDDMTYGKGTPLGAVIAIRTMGKPVIAAVNGPAYGMGASFALACDFRIASEKARFSMVFVKRGIGPDTAGSFTLPRIVGWPKAYELLLTGDVVDAVEAERIGMVNKTVPHENLIPAAIEMAVKIASNPPLAVAAHKQALLRSMVETDIIQQMKLEVELQDKLLNTEDFQEAATAFLEKRDPIFKGR